MAEMAFKVTGLDRMIEQFEDLARGGAARAAAERMDAHLRAGFAETQAKLAPHFKTGRTAASGRVESSYEDGVWRGSVTYGIEGAEGEHATGARWLLAQEEDDYLSPLDSTGQEIGRELDAYFRDALEG